MVGSGLEESRKSPVVLVSHTHAHTHTHTHTRTHAHTHTYIRLGELRLMSGRIVEMRNSLKTGLEKEGMINGAMQTELLIVYHLLFTQGQSVTGRTSPSRLVCSVTLE